MYELIYRNLETGALIKEYCFADYEEKRRLFIEDAGDLELISHERLMPRLWSAEFWKLFWRCLTNYTVQKDWEKA